MQNTLVENKEIEELIRQSNVAARFRAAIVGGGILIFPFLAFFLKLAKELILRFILAFFGYIILIFIFNRLIKKKKEKKDIEQINFIHIIFDFLFVSFLVHYGGGIAWILPFIYIGSLSFSYVTLPSKKAFILVLFLIMIINGMALFEFFGILPHHAAFSPDLYNDFKYITVTLSAFCGLILAIAGTLHFFAGSLRRQKELLEERYKETQEIKESLEIRVRARKEELKELSKKLDLEVAKKTKEFEKKVKELEEFNKQIIRRELKMLELKREIKKLKKL